jgi:adenosylmethionine-8-amino-7-oxononanoate aminotransferase
MSTTYESGGHVPVIVRGEGAYVWDDQGRRYLDGLAGLFVVQVGHGRQELADAAAEQAEACTGTHPGQPRDLQGRADRECQKITHVCNGIGTL